MNAALARLVNRAPVVAVVYATEGISAAAGSFEVSDTGTVAATNIQTTSGHNAINGTLTVSEQADFDGEAFFNNTFFAGESTANKYVRVEDDGTLKIATGGGATSGQVLTVGGDGVTATWEDSAGGGGSVDPDTTYQWTALQQFEAGISGDQTSKVLTLDNNVTEVHHEALKKSTFMTTFSVNAVKDIVKITADGSGGKKVVLAKLIVTAFDTVEEDNYPYITTFDLVFNGVVARDTYEEAVSYDTIYSTGENNDISGGTADQWYLRFTPQGVSNDNTTNITLELELTYAEGARTDFTVDITPTDP